MIRNKEQVTNFTFDKEQGISNELHIWISRNKIHGMNFTEVVFQWYLLPSHGSDAVCRSRGCELQSHLSQICYVVWQKPTWQASFASHQWANNVTICNLAWQNRRKCGIWGKLSYAFFQKLQYVCKPGQMILGLCVHFFH